MAIPPEGGLKLCVGGGGVDGSFHGVTRRGSQTPETPVVSDNGRELDLEVASPGTPEPLARVGYACTTI